MATPFAISLFTGAGGLDYGIEAAGFKVAAAVEQDRQSCETFRNHSDAVVFERSVFDVPTPELLGEAGLKSGEPSLLIAGPPCQPFSKSGYWARGQSGRLKDPRSRTLEAFLRVMEEAVPKTILLENVDALGYAGKNEGVRYLLESIEAINKRAGTNYRPSCRVLNAAEYGVPQFRSRFFMIACRDGGNFRFPASTHCEAPLFPGLEPYRTAWDAIGDVEPEADEDLRMGGKWADLLPSIPEGQNYLHHTARGAGLPLFGWRRRFWNFLLKLSKRAPSWTLQAQPGPATGPFHWGNRRLSMRELCRLQTFPEDVHIVGDRNAVQRQVGNAVPSLLAEVLAIAIREQFLPGTCPVRRAPKLLPPVRTPVPDPEPATPVPDKFKKLVGDHDPHPGTGLGFGATRRSRLVG